MKNRLRYVPSSLRLEDRLVLSHSPSARGLSVVVAGLHPRQQVLTARQQPIIAEVNQAFASFSSDYGQARATYFASIFNNPSPSSNTTNAFMLYTKQRVTLLANQIISSFLQVPQSSAHASGQQNALKTLVNNKIVNPQGGTELASSLASTLQSSIPQPGTSAATSSLYSLTQDNAIESARVAVINGVNIIKNGDFGNKTANH